MNDCECDLDGDDDPLFEPVAFPMLKAAGVVILLMCLLGLGTWVISGEIKP